MADREAPGHPECNKSLFTRGMRIEEPQIPCRLIKPAITLYKFLMMGGVQDIGYLGLFKRVPSSEPNVKTFLGGELS